jgi:hypothetical protein
MAREMLSRLGAVVGAEKVLQACSHGCRPRCAGDFGAVSMCVAESMEVAVGRHCGGKRKRFEATCLYTYIPLLQVCGHAGVESDDPGGSFDPLARAAPSEKEKITHSGG